MISQHSPFKPKSQTNQKSRSRMVISMTSTTFLHASLLYSFYSFESPKIVSEKTIKIALTNSTEMTQEKVQTITSKPVANQEAQTKRKPEKEPINEESKAEPIKKEPKIIKKPIEKPKPIIKKRPISPQKPQSRVQLKTNNKTKHSHISNATATKQSQPTKAMQDKLAQYLAKIRAKIQKDLKYPSLAKRLKLEGECIVAFEILDDGSVRQSSIKIKHSSGHRNLDKKAIETIVSVSLFEAPPNGKIQLIVPVTFTLNR